MALNVAEDRSPGPSAGVSTSVGLAVPPLPTSPWSLSLCTFLVEEVLRGSDSQHALLSLSLCLLFLHPQLLTGRDGAHRHLGRELAHRPCATSAFWFQLGLVEAEDPPSLAAGVR